MPFFYQKSWQVGNLMSLEILDVMNADNAVKSSRMKCLALFKTKKTTQFLEWFYHKSSPYYSELQLEFNNSKHNYKKIR